MLWNYSDRVDEIASKVTFGWDHTITPHSAEISILYKKLRSKLTEYTDEELDIVEQAIRAVYKTSDPMKAEQASLAYTIWGLPKERSLSDLQTVLKYEDKIASVGGINALLMIMSGGNIDVQCKAAAYWINNHDRYYGGVASEVISLINSYPDEYKTILDMYSTMGTSMVREFIKRDAHSAIQEGAL